MFLEAAFISVFLQYASQLSGIPITKPGYVPQAYSTNLGCIPNCFCLWGQTDLTTLTVKLHSKFDPNNNLDRCILVHELVHVLQGERDGVQPVTPAMETPAYAAQAQCLRAYHLDNDAAQIEHRVKSQTAMVLNPDTCRNNGGR